jgi:hypothetical protein
LRLVDDDVLPVERIDGRRSNSILSPVSFVETKALIYPKKEKKKEGKCSPESSAEIFLAAVL